MSPPRNESGRTRSATSETGPSEEFGSYLNAPVPHGSGSTLYTAMSA